MFQNRTSSFEFRNSEFFQIPMNPNGRRRYTARSDCICSEHKRTAVTAPVRRTSWTGVHFCAWNSGRRVPFPRTAAARSTSTVAPLQLGSVASPAARVLFIRAIADANVIGSHCGRVRRTTTTYPSSSSSDRRSRLSSPQARIHVNGKNNIVFYVFFLSLRDRPTAAVVDTSPPVSRAVCAARSSIVVLSKSDTPRVQRTLVRVWHREGKTKILGPFSNGPPSFLPSFHQRVSRRPSLRYRFTVANEYCYNCPASDAPRNPHKTIYDVSNTCLCVSTKC